jgi:hypothetical protein
MQSKKESLKESLINTSLGFAISLAATFLVLPLFGIQSIPLKNIGITICFTAISVLRSYLVRRYFNKIES